MDKTFAAIEKLKEVELELHRLKNYAEMMNRAVEAQREWQSLTDEEKSEIYNRNYNLYAHDMEIGDFFLIQQAIEAKLKEKNA
jgi:hypothetical protein